MDDYTTDGSGYYYATYYEQKGRNIRTVAFDGGELIIDNTEAREQWRACNGHMLTRWTPARPAMDKS